MSGLILDPTCLPLCRYKCNPVGMFRILKEINQQTKKQHHELFRDKYQNIHVLVNFFINGVSSVCTTATVMTIFVDNGDKGN